MQPACASCSASFSQKIWIAFLRLPAARINVEIIIPIIFRECAFNPGGYQIFLGFAPHRVAELPGSLGPILVERPAFDLQDMIVIGFFAENHPASLFKGALDQPGDAILIGKGRNLDPVRSRPQLPSQIGQQRQLGNFVKVTGKNRAIGKIIPVGEGGIAADTLFHQEHPRLCAISFGANDKRFLVWQTDFMQRFQPVEPVKQGPLNSPAELFSCNRLHRLEIIVIFTVHRYCHVCHNLTLFPIGQ